VCKVIRQTSDVPKTPDFNKTVLRKSPFVVIEARDHGVGIPEEDLLYIFEPFYRVEKSRSQIIKGYGLGLNLCKTIMEAHKGKIDIKSSPSEGTTVTLWFPEQQEASNRDGKRFRKTKS